MIPNEYSQATTASDTKWASAQIDFGTIVKKEELVQSFILNETAETLQDWGEKSGGGEKMEEELEKRNVLQSWMMRGEGECKSYWVK